MVLNQKALTREILLGYWKVHILCHAAEGPVVGQWMLRELRRHGYDVSPGTLYPLLARLERNGWLRCEVDPNGGLRARKSYYLTREGGRVLDFLRKQTEELREELVESQMPRPRRRKHDGRPGARRRRPLVRTRREPQ